MNETIVVGLIGGVCTLLAAAASAWLVYRRAVKVELVKNEQDTEIKLIDKWREYGEKLETVKRDQDAEISELKGKNATLEKDLREARNEISELRGIVELQAAQIRNLESRLNDLDSEGAPE